MTDNVPIRHSSPAAFNPLFLLIAAVVVGLSVVLLASPYYALAPVPALGLLFLLALTRYPSFGFYIIVFLVPYGSYRAFSDAYEFLTISKVVGFWIVLVVALKFLLDRNMIKSLRSNINPWLILFMMVNIVAALLSDFPITSWDFMRRLLTAYTMFFLTLLFVDRKQMTTVLPTVVIISTLVSASLSVIGYALDLPEFAMNIESESVKRGQGTSYDPNYFSAMLIFTLPLIAHFFFTARSRGQKILMLAVFAINFAGVVLTYSRGGALVLVAILALLFVEYMGRFRPRYVGFVLGFLAIGVIMVATLVPQSYWERQQSVTNIQTERSLGRRVSYLVVAWDLFKEAPIIGHGPGTFQDHYAQTSIARRFEKEGLSNRRVAHNVYVEFVVGAGLLGLVPFLIAVLVALRNFHRAITRYKNVDWLDRASLMKSYRLAFITMLLAFGMLSAQFLKYFWVALALSQVALDLAENEVPSLADDNDIA